MKSTTKVLAVLLLAMVIALLPGIDMTVYAAEAHSISTDTYYYPINYNDQLWFATHATLTSDKASAVAGDTVTLTLNLEDGYALKGDMHVRADKSSGGTGFSVDATPVEGKTNEWTFTMPDDVNANNYYYDSVFAWADIVWGNEPPYDTSPRNRNFSPEFYIAGDIEHGTVTNEQGIKTLSPPIEASDLKTPASNFVRLEPTPCSAGSSAAGKCMP